MNKQKNVPLPDPFLFENGSKVKTVKDWVERRKEILKSIIDIQYGGLPPKPSLTEYEILHSSKVKRLNGASFQSIRVTAGKKRQFSFTLSLLIPPGDGPFPVVLTGDGCWKYVTEEIEAEVVGRGNILAQFNRVEIVPDMQNTDCVTGLYATYPKETFGALSAWAWGYHRCVDVLAQMDFVDASKIAITGHSRGGKTVLLAGATDERIALVGANDSGSGGAGCYRWQGVDSEKLSDAIRAFSYWYGPNLKKFINREDELPFDQHFLKALIAPRSLLTTEALGDLWGNPSGTWQTYLGAKEVYQLLGAKSKIGVWYREGEHSHKITDWRAFLDFMELQFFGRKSEHPFNKNPFPDLESAFSWSSPELHS